MPDNWISNIKMPPLLHFTFNALHFTLNKKNGFSFTNHISR